jgi:hypothetical protein
LSGLSDSELTFEKVNPSRHIVGILGKGIGPSQFFQKYRNEVSFSKCSVL